MNNRQRRRLKITRMLHELRWWPRSYRYSIIPVDQSAFEFNSLFGAVPIPYQGATVAMRVEDGEVQLSYSLYEGSVGRLLGFNIYDSSGRLLKTLDLPDDTQEGTFQFPKSDIVNNNVSLNNP